MIADTGMQVPINERITGSLPAQWTWDWLVDIIMIIMIIYHNILTWFIFCNQEWKTSCILWGGDSCHAVYNFVFVSNKIRYKHKTPPYNFNYQCENSRWRHQIWQVFYQQKVDRWKRYFNEATDLMSTRIWPFFLCITGLALLTCIKYGGDMLYSSIL